jgi:hypothetical protein
VGAAVVENMQGISDIVDLEEFERQTSYSGKFGWGVSPNIARASVAREAKAIAKPAALIPADDEKGIAPADTPSGTQETTIISYTELIAGIQARIGELGIRQVDFDKLAGFAEGLTGKAFGAAQVKRLGPEKLFDAIRAAGLKLKLEADPEQLERMRKQIAENCQPRQAKQARMGNSANLSNKIIDGVLDYLANNKKDGLVRLNKATKQARSTLARHAANARWTQKRELPRIGYLVSYREACLGSVSRIGDRQALDSCAEEEATAA